jgi:hypothetical protein
MCGLSANAATITVPKPTTNGKPAAVAVVKLHGVVVGDLRLGAVGTNDANDAVAFSQVTTLLVAQQWRCCATQI